ncbi:hypothetical protein Bca101_071993 [Brassica carinata]
MSSHGSYYKAPMVILIDTKRRIDPARLGKGHEVQSMETRVDPTRQMGELDGVADPTRPFGLRELRRSIKFLVEFGDETLPPWWGLVGVGRRFDGESSSVCIKGDASAHTPDAYAAPECMGQDPRILRGRILARLRIRGMRRFNKTRRPKLRILMLDPAGLACAS